MGLPLNDIEKIDKFLHKDRLPKEVLDTVIRSEDEVSRIHPDNYPWDRAGDDITYGLFDHEINSRAIWENAANYIKIKYHRGMPFQCDVSSGFDQALTNLFEMYALAKYHSNSRRASR